ncbi:MAG: DUF5817 domain-containing protein [Halobacteriales archaeon]
MYRVVGCRDCGALWVVAERPETTRCPRCSKRHQFESLHAFAETEDEAAARRARGALLAERAGAGEAFEGLDDLGKPDTQLDAVGVDDAATLAAEGVDPESVADAGERASAGPARGPNRRQAVLGALDALDRPTEAEVVDYATDRGVPAEAVPALLSRLVHAGEVSESGGRYRRL